MGTITHTSTSISRPYNVDETLHPALRRELTDWIMHGKVFDHGC